MIIECKCHNKRVACEEVFTPVFTTFGGCFTFNSHEYVKDHEVWQSVGAGPEYGLFLKLNVNQDEYFYGPRSSAGFKVK